MAKAQRYSEAQLKAMADECMVAKSNGNLNWHMLVQFLSVRLRTPPQEIEKRILAFTTLEV